MQVILGRRAANLSPNRAAFGPHLATPPPPPAGTVAAVKTPACQQPKAMHATPVVTQRLAAVRPVVLVCALVIGWLATNQAASAQTSPAPALPAATVAQAVALAQQAAAALAPPAARVVVQAGTLDTRLQLAPCHAITPYLQPGAPAWGRTRVGLRCTQGASWNVQLPVVVQVFAPAVVLGAALPAGTRLQATSALTVAEVDWAAATGAPFTNPQELHQRVLARPMAAGQALRNADLQSRQWFATGDTVQIWAQGSGFAINSEGQAMGPGLEGVPVRVRLESGRVVVGRATAERRLEVQL
jgi:flagellar basal body P-ring formation protein FlgA